MLARRHRRASLDKHEETYRRIWEENRKLVRYLRQADAPIPEALAIVARHVLEQEALAELARLDGGGPLPERAVELVGEAPALGLTLDLTPARPALRRGGAGRARRRGGRAGARRASPPSGAWSTDAAALGLDFGLWDVQNRFFEIWRTRADARPVLAPLGATLGFNLEAEDA